MSSFLATMAERRPDGARVAPDPQCGRLTRNHLPRDDSSTGPQPIQRDRTRDVPSPQQRATEGEDHEVVSLPLGLPTVPLDFHAQEIRATMTNMTQPRLDPGFIQANKPISSEQLVFTCDCPRLHLFSRPCLLPIFFFRDRQPEFPTYPSLFLGFT